MKPGLAMFLQLGLLVATGISLFAAHAVGQQRAMTPQELEALRLRGQLLELQRKTRELELENQKRELLRAIRELEDKERLSRATALLGQHYNDALEASRQFFDGRTIEEVALALLSKGYLAAPDEIGALVKGYGAFKFQYQMRAHTIIRESVTNLDHSAQLRTFADSLISSVERMIFGKDTGIVHAAENHARAIVAQRQYELMSKLSAEQRMELAMCQIVGQLSAACKTILSDALK